MEPTLHKRLIEVVEYDSSWPELYEIERSLLESVLGAIATRIHHIGSTAVPGLVAKPVIDILMEVTSHIELDGKVRNMVGLGYESKGEFGIGGRRYYQKGGNNRTHQIHAFMEGDANILRHIAFRDYLRAHPETACEYGDLKKQVAASCGADIDRYCDGKNSYVKKLEKIAVLYAGPRQ